jgi:hypothetical protein
MRAIRLFVGSLAIAPIKNAIEPAKASAVVQG